MTWHAVTHLADTRAAAASSSGVNGTTDGLRRSNRLGDGRSGGTISICPEVLVEGRDKGICVGAGVGEGGDGSWPWARSGVEGEGEWGRESRDGVDIVSAVFNPRDRWAEARLVISHTKFLHFNRRLFLHLAFLPSDRCLHSLYQIRCCIRILRVASRNQLQQSPCQLQVSPLQYIIVSRNIHRRASPLRHRFPYTISLITRHCGLATM